MLSILIIYLAYKNTKNKPRRDFIILSGIGCAILSFLANLILPGHALEKMSGETILLTVTFNFLIGAIGASIVTLYRKVKYKRP